MALSRVKSDLIVKLDASKVVGALPALVGTNLLGVTAGGADQFSRNNLALNFFEDSVRDNMDRLSLSQGWVDTFEDASDVVGEGVSVPMTKMDGTNDNMHTTCSAAGLSTNGKEFIFSCIINFDVDDTQVKIANSSQVRWIIERTTSNKILVAVGDSGYSTLGRVVSTSTFLAAEGNIHLQVSVNTATQTIQIVKNGVLETNVVEVTLVDGTITLNNLNFWIGDTNKIKGLLGQFLFNNSFLDLSVQANREKFVSGTGASAKPVDFGADGSTPLGSQPKVFLNNTYDTFQNNLGSGGNFTEVGVFVDGGYINDKTYSSESFTNSYELVQQLGTSGTDGRGSLFGGGAINFGVALTASADTVLTGMGFYLSRSGSPTGNVRLTVHSATGTAGTNALPGNVLGVSSPVSVSQVTATGTSSPTNTGDFIKFDFTDSIPLTASQSYCFVLDNLDGTQDNTNKILVSLDNGPSGYNNFYQITGELVFTQNSSSAFPYIMYGNKNLDLITKGSDDIGNSPASAPDTGHMEILMTERPASGTTTWSDTLDTTDFGWAGQTLRQVITASTSGSRVRVTIPIGTSIANGGGYADNISIVKQSGSGPNGTTTPTEILYGGASGFAGPKGGSIVSDWIDYEVVAGQTYLLCIDFTSGGGNDSFYHILTGGEGAFLKGSANSALSQNMSAGYTALPNRTHVFNKLEIAVDQVVNTDYIAEMSRDGGTTYSPATLNRLKTRVGATNKNILGGAVDFAGDPSGTDIVGRVRSVNKDKITVHGVSVNWS